MVFCFSGIDFEDAICEYGEMFSPNDLILFSRNVLGTVDMPSQLNGKSDELRRLIEYGKEKEIIIIACMRAKRGSDRQRAYYGSQRRAFSLGRIHRRQRHEKLRHKYWQDMSLY